MASDYWALIYTAVTLALGAGLVYLCRRQLKIEGNVLLGAVFVAPLLFFLGLSGRLVEFKGFGIEAKLQRAALKTVTPKLVRPVEPSATAIQEISIAKAQLGIGAPVVLLKAPDKDRKIGPEDVHLKAIEIYPGLIQGKFELLVIIEGGTKVLGYFSREFFFDLLRIEFEQSGREGMETPDDNSKQVANQLAQTQLWDIVDQPKRRAESWGSKVFVNVSDTNAEALTKLATSGQDVAVVVTASGDYAGIVRRSDIVVEILEALTNHQ